MKFKKDITILTAALILFSPLTYAAATDGASWSYNGETGPQNWGNLDPAYQECSIGKEQAPINISKTKEGYNNTLIIHYPMTTAETGYDELTKLNIHGKKTVINDGHTLLISYPATSPEFIKIKDQKYQLIQFHVHTPSENTIDGKQFPIEIHFVNQSAKGDLAVLGVMFEAGNYNPALQQFLDQLPATKQALAAHKKITLRAATLLPSDRAYYTFAGSLTTPPCSEGVTWFLFSSPVEASEAQLQQLKRLLPLMNARPLQPLNSREILAINP